MSNSEILKRLVADADVLRELMRHPGMDLIRGEIDAMSGKLHSKWLLAPAEEAEKIRSDARGYELFFSLVKRRIIAGDEARKQMQSLPPE